MKSSVPSDKKPPLLTKEFPKLQGRLSRDNTPPKSDCEEHGLNRKGRPNPGSWNGAREGPSPGAMSLLGWARAAGQGHGPSKQLYSIVRGLHLTPHPTHNLTLQESLTSRHVSFQ